MGSNMGTKLKKPNLKIKLDYNIGSSCWGQIWEQNIGIKNGIKYWNKYWNKNGILKMESIPRIKTEKNKSKNQAGL